MMLRSLLCGEFAFSTNLTEPEILYEGHIMTEFLSREFNIQHADEEVSSTRMNSILYNLILPFVGSLHIICTILLEVNFESCMYNFAIEKVTKKIIIHNFSGKILKA